MALARQYACAEVPAVGEAWEDVALNECKVCVCERESVFVCVCVVQFRQRRGVVAVVTHAGPQGAVVDAEKAYAASIAAGAAKLPLDAEVCVECSWGFVGWWGACACVRACARM